MAHYVYVAMFLYAQMASGFIMPMTKANGETDVSSMVSHVTLLEQSMATLQAQVQTSNSFLAMVQTELASTKNEVRSLKAEMKTTELELNSTKIELKIATDFLHAVESRLRSAETEIFNFNYSVIDSIGNDVKTSNKNIEYLKSRISANSQIINGTKLDLELNAGDQRDLRRRCDSLGIQVNTTQRELQRFKVTQHGLWTNMSAKLTSLNTTEDLASLKSLILKERKNVAFQSRLSTGQPSTYPIRFDMVDLNTGGGYSEVTGYFTAPVAGTYMFWMQVNLHNSSTDCFLKKDTNRYPFAFGGALISSSIPLNTVSVLGLVHLNIGEKASIFCLKTNITIESYSVFSGTLLHAD